MSYKILVYLLIVLLHYLLHYRETMEVHTGSVYEEPKDYFRLIKRALWFCGVPIEGTPSKLYYCFTFFGIVGLMYSMIIMQIPSLFAVKEMDDFLDIMVYQTGYLSGE